MHVGSGTGFQRGRTSPAVAEPQRTRGRSEEARAVAAVSSKKGPCPGSRREKET